MARSSKSAESQAAAEALDEFDWWRRIWGELNGRAIFDLIDPERLIRVTPGVLDVDATSLYNTVHNRESSDVGMRDKRAALEKLRIRELLKRNDMRWVNWTRGSSRASSAPVRSFALCTTTATAPHGGARTTWALLRISPSPLLARLPAFHRPRPRRIHRFWPMRFVMGSSASECHRSASAGGRRVPEIEPRRTRGIQKKSERA